jgi:ubiquinone biosynthesis protein COQ9
VQEQDFRFDVEIDPFEKAGEGEKERRIAGFVSSASIDKQGEQVLQNGLDFQPFLRDGWFNDNHSRATADIVGYPESAKLVRKGESLPSGKVADRTGWYVEGYLLKGHPPADRIWELSRSLARTSRRLGFSIEGKVTRRVAKGNTPVIASAIVKNVAITNAPVNPDTALEVLTKSLDAMNKALAVGAPSTGSDPGAVPPGPLTGNGAARVLMPQSIEGYSPKKSKKKKRLGKSEALDVIKRRYPGVDTTTAKRIYAFAASRAAKSAA